MQVGRGGGAARLDSQLDVSAVAEDTSETSSISTRHGQMELGILPSGEGKPAGTGMMVARSTPGRISGGI